MSSKKKFIEKLLKDAALEGRIKAVGRKLQIVNVSEITKELQDIVLVDFSHNQLIEAPHFLCLLHNLEELNLSHNLVRHIHEEFSILQNLRHLDLSCNSLTELPKCLCQMESLEIFILTNNRICCIPDEISCLSKLIELDLSSNLLTSIPQEVVCLNELKILRLRHNLLLNLPTDIGCLSLRILDISLNRLSILPSSLHRMDSLEEFRCECNPLIYPSIDVQAKGLKHVLKCLKKSQALTEEAPLGESGLRKKIALADFTNRMGRKYIRLRATQTNVKVEEPTELTDSGYGSIKGLGRVENWIEPRPLKIVTGRTKSDNEIPTKTLDDPPVMLRRRSRPKSARPVGIVEVVPLQDIQSDEDDPMKADPKLMAVVNRVREVFQRKLSLELPSSPRRLLRSLRDGYALVQLVQALRPGLVTGPLADDPIANVRIFLEACRRQGVPEVCICSPESVLQGDDISPLAHTLLSFLHNIARPSFMDIFVSLVCVAILLLAYFLLPLLPLNE